MKSHRISIEPEHPGISIVIPAFNEEDAIEDTVRLINSTMEQFQDDYEIIVVDDCSTDSTAQKLDDMSYDKLRVIRHSRNRGYGAALKTGFAACIFPLIAITDADGTYPNERIPELALMMGDRDMVVGARTGSNVSIPLIRRPAKWFIGQLANYLSRCRIPDINSGLRVFRKQTLEKYISILPDGFSLTTTITLAMLTSGREVEYVPVDYAHRVGKSKIKPVRDTLNFIQLIIRTIVLFEPLRVFLPVAILMFLASVSVLFYSNFFMPSILDMSTTLLFIGSLQILATGMIADMINRRL